MTHVHTLRGSNSTSCTFVGRESYRGDAYNKGEKTFPCFVLVYITLVPLVGLFLDAYILHVFCIGRVLDMHLSLYYCALLIACSDDHLLYYMIIVVISI